MYRGKLKTQDNILKMWSNGVILKAPNLINSDNFALHYGSPAVWEGLRSYKTSLNYSEIFELEAHVNRLFDSAKIIGITIPYTKNDIMQACKHVVEQNKNEELYIRPIVYINENIRYLTSESAPKINVDIYAMPIPADSRKLRKGIKTAISSYTRGYPEYQMQAKGSFNYHFIQLCNIEAKQQNVDDMLLTDKNGHITEATVANIFIIKNGIITTPPNDGSILPGITRKNIANIINNFKIWFNASLKVPILIEKKITRAELYTADEIFLCGTLVEIMPVIEVDGRIISKGKPGIYTSIVLEYYRNLVRKCED